MLKLFSVPRINALGLFGPEKSSKKILYGLNYQEIETKNNDISYDEDLIYKKVKKEIKNKCFFIGGDHSITYPIGKAFLEKYDKRNSFMIIFDAHADLMKSMKEPTHEEVFYGLLKYGWKKENLVFIGLRKIEPEEGEIIVKKKIKYFSGLEKTNEIMNYLRKKTSGKKVYVSIDIDNLDPKDAPGVNYKEKKGLKKNKFFEILREIKEDKKIDVRVYDLVEIVCEKDINNKTLNLAREIVKEIIKK